MKTVGELIKILKSFPTDMKVGYAHLDETFEVTPHHAYTRDGEKYIEEHVLYFNIDD